MVAALLGLGAAVETLARAGGDVPLPLALFLALGTTTPVAAVVGGPARAAPGDGRPGPGSDGPARLSPAVAAATATAAGVVSLAAFGLLTVAGLCAVLVCDHRAGRRGPGAVAAALPVPFVAYAVAAPVVPDTGVRLLAVLAAVCTTIAAGAGLARTARDIALAGGETERAVANTLLEHAARGERARIARELHDVVAHHISMIAVQAETARLTTPGLPPAGAERLLAIGDTARTALTEMRRLLGVLREDAGPEPGSARRPQPGLEQLGELVDQARDASAGTIRLIVEGPVRPMDPGVELTAYRVVQEALTNARRHAPGAAVDVELRYTADALLLRVRDNGPGPRAAGRPGGGHGLLGMRERAAMVGGELRAGPARRGGFLVDATFPAPVRERAA
jgi:signal transduction histidine kinase